MKSKQNVILIGMPGVGKSTVGVLLAKRMGYSFLDTDIYIQTREGEQLQAIINRRGIDYFCRMEESHVLSIACDSHVIATGGSVVYGRKAMAHLKQLGVVIHLDLELAALKERLGNLDSRGVVMVPGQGLDSLYDERQPLYHRYADSTVTCGGLSPDQVVQQLHAVLIR